jgi:hypothetical protein
MAQILNELRSLELVNLAPSEVVTTLAELQQKARRLP